MENTKLSFTGSGLPLLKLLLSNWVLNLLTLGLYYPWARVRMIRYFWSNTFIGDTAFEFVGTGAEIFKGYIKLLVLVILFYSAFIYAQVSQNVDLLVAVMGIGSLIILAIIPLAVHGALRYRTARTTWRGIHLGYRGDRWILYTDFMVGYFLSLITLGIYYAWFINRLRTYIIGNLRLGNMRFAYDGTGADLLILQIKGTVLSILTLGLYWFWYRHEWMSYFAQRITLTYRDQTYRLRAHYSGWALFSLYVTNFIIIIFTLGIGTPWTTVRTYDYIIGCIELPQELDLDLIQQTEDEYGDATGDYIADFFDLGVV